MVLRREETSSPSGSERCAELLERGLSLYSGGLRLDGSFFVHSHGRVSDGVYIRRRFSDRDGFDVLQKLLLRFMNRRDSRKCKVSPYCFADALYITWWCNLRGQPVTHLVLFFRERVDTWTRYASRANRSPVMISIVILTQSPSLYLDGRE